MAQDYEDFRIWHRHLSECDARDRYCRRTGTDPHDLDERIAEDSERRRAKYREIDGY